jgi:hypothetical protein
MIFLNYLIVWPILCISYFIYIISNISNLFIDDWTDKEKKINSFYGLYKFEDESYFRNFAVIHLVIFLFAIYSKILNVYINNSQEDNKVEELKDIRVDSNENLHESLVNLFII